MSGALGGFFRSRERCNLAIAALVALLLHALAFFLHFNPPPIEVRHASSAPLTVELFALKAPKPAASPPSHPSVPKKIIAARKPSRKALSEIEQETSPHPAPEAERKPPPMSFLDYVNAARAHRAAAADEYPAKPEAVGPLPDRGAPRKGTSGIFKILRMDDNSAEFSFLGWHSEFSSARREVFEVDAGPDGNVRLAVVRKMIEIIRRYYDGDFNWNSERLGGDVVLSARMKDDAELQAFLMKEFFGAS